MSIQIPTSAMDAGILETHGFVSLNYPPALRACMQEAMRSWQEFCKLPLGAKQLLSGGDRIVDFGYMRRIESGPRSDEKELFHALRAHFHLLLPKADAVGDARATRFIRAVDALIHEMESLVRDFARSVEARFGLVGFEDEVMAGRDHWTFRYLRYPPGARPVLANAHGDKGPFTFHLGETAEGGEYYGFDKIWRPWPVSEKETIIFPGMGLQYRSGGKLKALWHRVVPNEETILSGRYSMVAFIDFPMSHRINESRMRMQDFEPGFNYEMSFDEFRMLFLPC